MKKNYVEVMGNVVRDIKVRTLENGMKVANFCIGVNEEYNEKNTSTFLDVTAWGRATEGLDGLKKGTFVNVTGKLRNNNKEINGVKFTSAYILAVNVAEIKKGETTSEVEIPEGFEEVEEEYLPFQ